MTQCGSRAFCLQWRLRLCHWVNSTCFSVPTSWIALNYLETEKNLHLFLRLSCLQSAAERKPFCQCKQMRGNYFRITTALCHLTAVLLLVILDHPRSLSVDRNLCSNFVSIGSILQRYQLWSNISQVWLKTAIPAPNIYVFGRFWPPKHYFSSLRPKRHFVGGKLVLYNSVVFLVRSISEGW